MTPKNATNNSVSRSTLAEQVYHALKKEIILQHTPEMKMGVTIKEVEIAKRLGCSPTPVREAINMLRQDNLIVGNSFHSSEVISFSQKDIQDLLIIRTELEVSAVRQAMPNVTQKDIVALKRIQKEYAKAQEGMDFTQIAAINADFHNYILALAKNRTLTRILMGLADQTAMLRAPIVEERQKRTERNSPIAVLEHDSIVQGFENSDCEAACNGMLHHMERVQQEVCEYYEKQRR